MHQIGEVVNPDNPIDITNTISRLINDPVRYSQYRSNAETAAANFTWEQESRNLLAIYRSLEQKIQT
jgi:glycosyltransferase involved in cell wall biosynthesis